MLRTWKALPVGPSLRARSLAVVVLVLVVCGLAGLRSPAGSGSVLAQAPEDEPIGEALPSGFDTRYVSEDGGVLYAFRPARSLRHASLKDVRKLLDETVFEGARKRFGFHPADIDQLIASSDSDFTSPYKIHLFIRATKPIDFSRLIERFTGTPFDKLPGRKYGDATIYRVPYISDNHDFGFVEQRALWMPDDRTLVYDTVRHLRRYIDGDPVGQLLVKSDAWRMLNEHDGVLLADQESMQKLLEDANGAPQNPMTTLLLNPLIGKARLAGVSMVFESDLRFSFFAGFRNAEDAAAAKESVAAARVLARNMLDQLTAAGRNADGGPQVQFAHDPIGQNLIQAGSALLAEMKIEQRDKSLQVSTAVTVSDLQLSLFAPAVLAARAAARRAQSMNNLRQIALAFHNHHDLHKRFPGSATIPEGKRHPVSWRVALLPHIAQEELYKQYNLDEPWDSENNRRLIDKMPVIYRHPDTPDDATSPSYFVLTGPDTIFRSDTPRIQEIHDGTANTILAVEAKRDIPWTKPEDIPFDQKVIPELGGFAPDHFSAAFADGSVKTISKQVDAMTLKLMIMSQDGQPLPR